MTRIPVPADLDYLVERYERGESVKAIATDLGMTRANLTRFLRMNGVKLRDSAEANRVMAARRTPEENARNAEAAHAAVRGTRQTAEHRARIAQAKHGMPSGSALEMLYAEWLSDLQPVHQFAVGPYNCDLMIEPVAVEINGGHWHAHGHHAARAQSRAQYILDQGYNIVFVWVTSRTGGARVESADYIRSFVQQTRLDPALRGQYRMVWGDGQVTTAGGTNVYELSRVPPRSGYQH